MRELICTVSGQNAETKSNKIRIIHDRQNNPHSWAKGDFLSDSSFGRIGSVRPSLGLCESSRHGEGSASGISPQIGEDGQTSRSNGRDRRITFPLKVKLSIACGSLVVVAAAWMLPTLVMYLVGQVSHLSGFWWLVGGAAAYLLTLLFIFALMKIAAVSDRRIAEIGRGK